MRDIETRNDLMLIMKKFYDLLLSDHRINFFFTETTNVNLHLEDHFETLATFWEQALFFKGGYKNNMFKIHQNIHQKRTFTPEHFNIWLSYLNQSIDENFSGPQSEQMKTQALSMATVMQIKFSQTIP